MKLVWVLVILLLACAQIGLVSQYPAYQYWDMDHLTMIDLLLLRSHIMPDHMAHPGFGLNYILNGAYEIMSWLKMMPVENMDDFKTSLNPILVASKITINLRYFMALLNITTATLFAFSLINIFKTTTTKSLIIFLVFATQIWISIHSPIIRSESVALFFIAVSFYVLSSMKSGLQTSNLRLIVLSGFFAGVALLTKIQSIGYLVVLPLVFQLIDQKNSVPLERAPLKNNLKALTALISMFILLLIGLQFYTIPANIENFRTDMNKASSIALFIFLVLGGLFFVETTRKFFHKPLLNIYFSSLDILPLFLSGVFLSFMLPLTLGTNFVFNANYTLAVLKTLLNGKIITYVMSDTKVTISIILERVFSFWPWIVLLLSLKVLALKKWFQSSIKEKNIFLTTIVLLTIAMVIFVFIVRNIWRQDIVWFEPLVMWLALFILLFTRSRFSGVVIGFVFVFQMIHVVGFHHYTAFSDREEYRLFEQVYGNNQAVYTQIINQKFKLEQKELRVYAAQQARRSTDIENALQHQLPTSNILLKNVSVVAQDMPADSQDINTVFFDASQNLVGLSILQLTTEQFSSRRFFDKLKLGPLKETVSDVSVFKVRSLKDHESYIAVNADAQVQFEKNNPDLKRSENFIRTRNRTNEKQTRYMIFEVPSYNVSVNFQDMKGPFYFLYREKIRVYKSDESNL